MNENKELLTLLREEAQRRGPALSALLRRAADELENVTAERDAAVLHSEHP